MIMMSGTIMHGADEPVRARVDSARVSRRGMTLLEVIIAMGLTGMLLASVYIFYANILATRQAADKITTGAQLFRVTIDRIADDVRYAGGYTPGFGVGLTGDKHSISIYRYVLPETDVFNEYQVGIDQLPPAKADLRNVKYSLVWDEENKDDNGDPLCHGLFRSIQKTLNQLIIVESKDNGAMPENALDSADNETPDDQEGGEAAPSPLGVDGELVAPEIKYLRFAYFDGAEWTDTWVGGDKAENALPQAVMITIGRIPVLPDDEELDDEEANAIAQGGSQEIIQEHPDRFSMIVRLEQADRFLNSRMVNAKNQFGDMSAGLSSQGDDFKRSLRSQSGSGIGSKSR
jgi:prepilin-type N-terminal cleavage/methylation domain-containing protein